MFLNLFRFLAAVIAFLPASISAEPNYVGSEHCVDCHTQESTAWASSHHAQAWALPSDDTIVADFDDTQFEHDGTITKFRTQDGNYFVSVTEKDGVTTDYPVHSVAGIDPLQQYLLETEPGRLQSFDVVWGTEEQKWLHMYPDQDLPPNNGLHWTGPYKNWNGRCAECHATGYDKNYDGRTKLFSSTQSEIGVGCEACHGPASAHLEWTKEEISFADDPDLNDFGFSMTFGQNVEQDIQQCAGCHARRETLEHGNPLPGTPFAESYNLAVLRPDIYHPDGQIEDEVYVYGSFLQSKMYAQGVGCMNCHDPHTGNRIADDNSLCTQCHSTAGNTEFPTLRKAEYDTLDHHFHPQGSTGAECKNCHMIERTYMGVDGRRDHSFRIPRPDLSAQTGAPNACSDCHSDQSASWAAEQIETWYPDSQDRGVHYGQTFSQAIAGSPNTSTGLLALALDENQPNIVRATGLYIAQNQGTPEVAQKASSLLKHSDPLLRVHALRLQRFAPRPEQVSRVAPLLNDPVKSVRIAAARELLNVDPTELSRSLADAKSNATQQWVSIISGHLDYPETHLILGGLALSNREAERALSAFREVVRLDPQRTDAWSMVVRITAIVEGPEAARKALRDGLSHVPNDPILNALVAQFSE